MWGPPLRLARSARLDVSAMEELVDKLLRSVKFLDERRALFDEGRLERTS